MEATVKYTGVKIEVEPIGNGKYKWMDRQSGVFYKDSELQFKIYGQQCQDPELTDRFRELHKELVNRVIEFCKENHIDVDVFYLHADGIKESISYGSWQPCTDSGFEMYSRESLDEGDPEPFLFSM